MRRPSSAGSPSAEPTSRSGRWQWRKKSGSVSNCETPMTALSGGQAARAGLASLLLSRYDIFLLDEPTNDLDLEGLDRLEQFVADVHRQGSPLVVVSHDREFLSRVVTRVVEIDRAQHQVNVFGGGYEAYLQEREVARQHARDSYEEYAETLGNPAGAGAHPARVDGKGRPQRAAQGDRQRQVRPQVQSRDEREAGGQSAPDRSPDRAARGGAGAAQGMAAADVDRAGAACRCGGGEPAKCPGTSRIFHARSGDAADRLGRPGGHHRGQRQRQVDTARRAARPACRSMPERRASARESWSARSIRHGRHSKNPARSSMFSGNRCPRSSPAELRTLLAKFGLGAAARRPADVIAFAGRAHPGGTCTTASERRQPARARRTDESP